MSKKIRENRIKINGDVSTYDRDKLRKLASYLRRFIFQLMS